MTRAPSAVLVVRHGARLDASDANWHLTSPTPYDPPLTYGGWNQAKALGVRIANILRHRATESNATPNDAIFSEGQMGDNARRPRKKQKVVIHTSPFLRCLQTSVAIGAGMGQTLEISEHKNRRGAASRDTEDNFEQKHDSEKFSVKALGFSTPEQDNIKTVLRVDAFLGEWLSPDYFDKITPPPNSTMMVASAKAHLLKREQIEVFQTSNYKTGHFPGGWSRANISREAPSSASTAVEDDNISLDRLSLLAPLRQQRSNSASSTGDKNGNIKPILSSLKPSKAAYDPPIPAYAVKPSDPIPRGYCVHARDACTDLNLLWDSMRFPQDWGDGGEVGEEWSAMHKRFRKGLAKMLEWYSTHTPEFHPDREAPLALDHDESEDEDEDDYDLTLILVTHAAGCNALVGALTNQPVLHDFGLTSLSMAVLKSPDPLLRAKIPSPVNGRSNSPSGRRRSSVYMGLSDEYEMQILSSTTHLRAGAQAARASALTSPHLVPKIPAYECLPHTPDHSQPEPKRAMSTALGSIRRPSLSPTAPLSSDSGSSLATSPSSSTGLWSRASTVSSTADEVPSISIGAPAHVSQPASDAARSRSVSPMSVEQSAKKENDEVPPLPTAMPSRSLSQRSGLWSVPKTDRRTRGPLPKRRWTVTEQDGFD